MATTGTKNVSQKVFNIFNTVLMVLICCVMIYPPLNMLAISLSKGEYVMSGKVTIFPKGITIDAYRTIFEGEILIRAYNNTLFVVIVGTIISVLLTSFAAYPLSKDYLPAKEKLTFFLALTIWFSGGMIPTFLVVRGMGLLNSLWALIIPGAVQAFHVIIMRNFFKTIPNDLEDSARIDGCNDAAVLFRIIYPLSKPVLATIALWVAVAQWNSFMPALLYLNRRELYTLQLVIRDIVLQNTAFDYGMVNYETHIIPESIKYATVIVATAPVLVFYPFIQKYFVKGVYIGSMKG